MHQLVLLTAMTATTGLFGGHKSCGSGHGARPGLFKKHHAYAAPVATCSTGTCYSAPLTSYATPTAAPQAMPVPPKAASAPAMAPSPYYVQSYYYAPTSPCANGQCYRR